MKGRGVNGGGSAADFLVCFPSRAHLALMPKPICSPLRSADPPKHHASRPSTRGQASPLFKTKARNVGRGPAPADVISEPTSPKVTCAGQIKVSRPKPRAAEGDGGGGGDKSWLSVMEEMEDRQRRQRQRQRHGRGHWLETLGLKKDAMHLLHVLRGLRLHLRCFGSFRGTVTDCTSDEEDEETTGGEEEEEDNNEEGKHDNAPQSIFSKWFMLLEECPSEGTLRKKVEGAEKEGDQEEEEEEEEEEREGAFGGCLVTLTSPSTSSSAPPPPPNALLLMRCRSAPAKGWPNEGDKAAAGEEGEMMARKMREEEKEKERLVLMNYAPDFFRTSPDIAKETWVVGNFDPLARSRSWKR